MSLTPARLARIREHHERALTGLSRGDIPTTHQVLELIGDLSDMLTDHTNRTRP